jgi:hypothetical protein
VARELVTAVVMAFVAGLALAAGLAFGLAHAIQLAGSFERPTSAVAGRTGPKRAGPCHARSTERSGRSINNFIRGRRPSAYVTFGARPIAQ